MESLLKQIRQITRRRPAEDDFSPFWRNYSLLDLFIWCGGSVFGTDILALPSLYYEVGPTIIYARLVSGVFIILPLLCYMEMSGMMATIGGPYHFAYTLCNELTAFFVGWTMLFSVGANLAFMASDSGTRLDEFLFDKAFGTVENFTAIGTSRNINLYFNPNPHFLGSLIAFSIVILCGSPIDVPIFNGLLFVISFSVLLGLVCLFVGTFNYQNTPPFNFKTSDLIFNNYALVNRGYFSIIYISFLGKESTNPTRDIPISEGISFIFIWLLYAVFTWLFVVQLPDLKLYHELEWIPLLAAHDWDCFTALVYIAITTAHFHAMYVYATVLQRLVVAMARDGLLFKCLSRVEHVSRSPVKTAIALAFVISLTTCFVHPHLLKVVSGTGGVLTMLYGPYLVFHARYTYRAEDTEVEQSKFTRWRYTSAVVVTLCFAIVSCGWSFSHNYISTFHLLFYKWPTTFVTEIIVFFVIAVVSLVILAFQPRNLINSVFRVPLVPYTPALGMFIVAVIAPQTASIGIYSYIAWFIFGFVFYLSYSESHSVAKLTDFDLD